MKGSYYKWVVCAAGTVAIFCCLGLCGNVTGYWLPYIEADYLTPSQGSLIISLRSVFGLMTTFIIMPFIDRFKCKASLIVGVLTCAVSAAVMAYSKTPFMFYVGAAFSGFSVGFGNLMVITMLFSEIFDKHKGLAIGIASAGSSLSGIVFSSVLAPAVERVGLKNAFLLEAAIAFGCAVLVFILIDDRKIEKLKAAVAPASQTASGDATLKKYKASELLTKPLAFAAFMSLVLLGGTSIAGGGHMSVVMVDMGYTASQAARVLAVTAFAGLALKLFFGVLVDLVGTRAAGWIYIITFAIACFVPTFMDGKHLAICYAFAFLVSAGANAVTAALPLWAIDVTKPRSSASVMKLTKLGYSVGGILISDIPGIMAEKFGSYIAVYHILGVLTVAGLVCMDLCYIHRRRHPVAAD